MATKPKKTEQTEEALTLNEEPRKAASRTSRAKAADGEARTELKKRAGAKAGKAAATQKTAAPAPKTAVKKTARAGQAAPGTPEAGAEPVKAEQQPVPTPEESLAEEARTLKVLFAVSECQPFIATGGLGDVAGSLPKALAADGRCDIRVVLPLYGDMPWHFREKLKFLCNFSVILGWRQQYCGVFELEQDHVRYYFVDNEYYFKRSGLYGHYDDGERFAYFSKAVMEILPRIDFYPDVLHCNDWQTALIPVYFKVQYQRGDAYRNIKTVFTIHNIEYQGKYSMDILEDLFGISYQYKDLLEYNGLINLMKGAIQCCDRVTTVSPTYAREILSPVFSHGLNYILKQNEGKLIGILNGIDTDSYDPASDPALFKNYDAESPEGKTVNKTELQKMLFLPQDPEIPMVAVISRLVAHKGIDLIREGVEDMLRRRVQLVVLGKGDAVYENYFLDLQKSYSEKVRAIIAYNPDTSRKIYAAADLFLMPSRSEPCGLSQMIASRYGAIPVIRETGGLYDSIRDIGCEGGGNGFTFARYDCGDMLNRVYAALDLFQNKGEWKKLVERVMRVDFSWSRSAKIYGELYLELLN